MELFEALKQADLYDKDGMDGRLGFNGILSMQVVAISCLRV